MAEVTVHYNNIIPTVRTAGRREEKVQIVQPRNPYYPVANHYKIEHDNAQQTVKGREKYILCTAPLIRLPPFFRKLTGIQYDMVRYAYMSKSLAPHFLLWRERKKYETVHAMHSFTIQPPPSIKIRTWQRRTPPERYSHTWLKSLAPTSFLFLWRERKKYVGMYSLPHTFLFTQYKTPRVRRPLRNGRALVLTGREVASPSGWKRFCLKCFFSPGLVPNSTDE